MKALLRVDAIREWPTGEIDVVVDNGGEPLEFTVDGSYVLRDIIPEVNHWSDCNLFDMPTHPQGPCSCRVGFKKGALNQGDVGVDFGFAKRQSEKE